MCVCVCMCVCVYIYRYLHIQVLPSDDADENYLTTIERPCCVMHLEAVPADIRASWLKVCISNIGRRSGSVLSHAA